MNEASIGIGIYDALCYRLRVSAWGMVPSYSCIYGLNVLFL